MITWTDAMGVGVQKVDDQHKQLVEQINKLHTAMMERRGAEVVGSTLEFLKNYAITHFATEEGLMRVYAYPNYEAHKKLHDDFKVDFLKLAKEITDNPHSSMVTLEVENRLSTWLVNHIKRVDKDTFKFLSEKGAK